MTVPLVYKTDSKYIQWNKTKNVVDGSRILKKMYESLLDTDPVKSYIENFCLNLLSLSGTTGKLAFDKATSDYEYYSVKSNNKTNRASNYKGKSGLYVFECLDTGFQYIGSTSCLYTRYKAHMINSTRIERGGNNAFYQAARKFGWNRFVWKPIHITNNHMINFLSKNPCVLLNNDSLYILRSFTQFEARVLEQALLSHYIPKLNSNLIVSFPFVNWEKGAEIKLDGSVALNVESEDRKFSLVYSSKNRAAVALGISNTTLNRYINLQNHSVYSSVLDMKVFLIDPTKPLTQDSPNYSNQDSISPISGVDLYAIEKGKLFALHLDKQTVYGVYDKASHAALSLDGRSDKKYILRYINLEYPVIVGPNRDSVFFVMNPEWKMDISGRIAARPLGRKKSSLSKSIVLVDIKDNSALLFDTVSDLLAYLGIKSVTDTGFVKKYML